MAVAWLSEIEERDPDGNALCTGRFECEGEELPFREAVAWARAHADAHTSTSSSSGTS